MAAKSTTQVIEIPAVQQESIRLRIIGTTPMIQNRMAAKAKQTFLVGSQKKTKAERVEIKHNPMEEYVDSAERLPDGPTALGLRVVAIKTSMCVAALETKGVTKASAQRLLFMPGEHIPLYGKPQLDMRIVRSADMNKTPDIRTRLYLPQWCAEIKIRYIAPQLNPTSVTTMLCNAGILIGVGDGRQDKGALSFGCFRVIAAEQKDAEWTTIKKQGRATQLAALKDPVFSTQDTAELMAFYIEELAKRGEPT